MIKDQIIKMGQKADQYANWQTNNEYDWRQIRDERFAELIVAETKREWVGLMQGLRVEEDKVIICTKNNELARKLCAELLRDSTT